MTYSRSAWIGAAVILLLSYRTQITRYFRLRELFGAALVLLFLLAYLSTQFSGQILRLSSTRGHFTRPLMAIEAMKLHPWGQGLGTAGPATNRTSDACVELRPQDDPSWAKDQPNLCVFLGDKQVQPTDRACHCPFLPENWYLQIGVEMGWIGMILFVMLVCLLLQRLWKDSRLKPQDSRTIQRSRLAACVFSVLLGISIASLFLHAWEDAAVAYTAWIVCAVSLHRLPRQDR
jgi:O-antigen ligase